MRPRTYALTLTLSRITLASALATIGLFFFNFYEDQSRYVNVVKNNIRGDDVVLAQEGNFSYSGHWEKYDALQVWEFGPTPSVFDPNQQNNVPYSLFSGKSILVIGGSTSRDLAGDFMQLVLPSEMKHNVSKQWAAKGRANPGFTLFSSYSKKISNFQNQGAPNVMMPLQDAGWTFEHLDPSLTTSGCAGCRSPYTNIDYVATFQSISYEYSWKPEILSPSDEESFRERYCKRKYDIVFFGRGLHDAAFYSPEDMTRDSIRLRFEKLADILKCLSDETLIIFRSPYISWSAKDNQGTTDVTIVLSDMIAEGLFDSESGKKRSILVNGSLLTSRGAPGSHDGRHYNSHVARSLWKVIFTIFAAFLGQQKSLL